MKRDIINPKDYEYLWTDYDVNFIFTSCYLFKEFRETDIVLVYDWKDKALKFFLSKKDREKFSDQGVIFYEKHFPEWKEKIIKSIEKGKELIEEKNDKNKISSMSNEEIKNKIQERVNVFQALGGNYFYTEFFFLDKVEKIIEEPKYVKVRKNFEEMGALKFQAREVLNEFYNYNKIFAVYVEEVAKRTKRKDVQWLSYQEIIELLKGKKIELSNRNRIFWILAKKNNWNMIIGEKAEKIASEFEDYFFNKNVEVIKGAVANKGTYNGTVKIIRTFFSDKIIQELKKVKQGDVLVAETTGPEMMIACKRAGAIVTDEGGLTSHAAIVSRELGIPCIVGTKIATKSLKDGDLVEVNANNGVVRIIKKS